MMARIRKWLWPPVFAQDEDQTRIAALLNIIVWVFIMASGAYGLLAPIAPEMHYRRLIIIGPFILLLLVVKQIINVGHIRLAGNLVVFLLWAMFTAAMLYGADYHNPAFMGYLVVVVCAGLILNWRAAIGWSLFSIVTNAVLLELGQLSLLPHSDNSTPPFAFWTAQTAYIVIATFMLSQTLRKIDEARARAERELKERKRVEAEREKVIKELESKNAELERFTYTVSHDLKSPLITIGGFVGLLEEDARSGNTAKFEKDLMRIREAKDKMHRLLEELLELSRIGRVINPSVNIPFAQIVEEALALTRGRLMAGHVQVSVAKDLPMVHGDAPRLVEVLQNLIDNAAKFMGDQPKPLIEIGALPHLSLPSPSGRQDGSEGKPIFFVKDNGIGINPNFHEKIFGLFDKLDPKSEGTGVGLSLVKRIIEVHGGKIWMESEGKGKGKGTTFYFTLPVVEA